MDIEVLNDCDLSIFGVGAWASRTYLALSTFGKNIRYFVVSNDHKKGSFFYDHEIIRISDFANISRCLNNQVLIVACSEERYQEIEDILKEFNAIKYFRVNEDDLLNINRLTHPIKPVDFVGTTIPVSYNFGFDRGTPVDRYYIDSFLQSCTLNEKKDGLNVLEVGDNRYTSSLFDLNNIKSEVLDFSNGEDLTDISSLKQEKFDVFICTQVLQCIYDVKKAIEGTYYLLKKNGILIATVSGNISPVARYSYDNWGYYWGFTDAGIKNLIEEIYGKGNVEVIGYGNSATATAFVQGIAVEDLDKSILDFHDHNYDILIGVRAIKR